MLYEDVRKQLKTGDIILFSGNSVASNFIKLFSGSKFSHVGIVVNIPGHDLSMVWESVAMSSIKDIELGECARGVQTVPLSARHATYNGEMYVRHLDKPITIGMLESLLETRTKLKHLPYEQNELELAKSLLDFAGLNNTEDLSSLFCSELVAEAYKRMAILPYTVPSNEYIPNDFSEGRAVDDLLIGYTLGPVIEIE